MFIPHMPELIALLVVALLVFGPKRVPEIGSSLGRGIRDFKKGVAEVQAVDPTQAQLPAPTDGPKTA
jgi:sec-independent protein translocase protein TatA